MIVVEKDETKHILCNNPNPPETVCGGGVIYDWHVDVCDITTADVEALGTGCVGSLDISSPCKDFALSRLLPSKYGGKLQNPCPGRQGKHGKVFKCYLQVLAWVHELNPNCKNFSGNMQFEVLEADRRI